MVSQIMIPNGWNSFIVTSNGKKKIGKNLVYVILSFNLLIDYVGKLIKSLSIYVVDI